MVFYSLAAAVLFVANHVDALAGLAVDFERFSGPGCNTSLPLGQVDDLHNNLCKNWPGEPKFSAFRYSPHETDRRFNKYFWMYDLPDCNVAIYSEKNCRGERYIPGPFPDTHGMCASGWGWKGKSVGVACDKAHPYGSIRFTTGSPKGKGFDYQSQVEAAGIEHQAQELDCCKNPTKCTGGQYGTTWGKKTCFPHAQYNSKTAGGRDRLKGVAHDMQWRMQMQAELKQSASESKQRREHAEKMVKSFASRRPLHDDDVRAFEDATRYLDYGDD